MQRVAVRRNQPGGKWVCKGPQGHIGKARNRWEAMVEYARRRVAGATETDVAITTAAIRGME